MSIRVRKSNDRGHANHGWLDSYHTFSFADYHDEKFDGFGSLRVINEDRVTGGNGFGKHPHRNFEIFSYVISGSLRHNDSLGNEEIIKPGEVQFTSAGKGLAHSEFNASKTDKVHFIQMWVKPWKEDLEPTYHTKFYSEEAKKNKLAPIGVKKGDADAVGAIPINQDVAVYASVLEQDVKVTFPIRKGRKVYIHLIQNGGGHNLATDDGKSAALNEGDGAFVEGVSSLEITSTKPRSEFILFDLDRLHSAL